MPKITFIGAGSTVFAKNLLGDILSFPELANSTISLMDIDPATGDSHPEFHHLQISSSDRDKRSTLAARVLGRRFWNVPVAAIFPHDPA